MRNRITAWLVALALLAPVALFAEPEPREFAPALQQKLEQEMDALVSSKVTPSLSVVVVQGGRVVFSRAVGSADQEHHIQATARTPYRIGSTTKMFTGLAIMQLVEQGKLSLDDRLERFQPDFPNASSITVRQLLQHRSGIPNYLDQALRDGSAMQATTPQAIVAAMAKMPPESTPGSKYSYSNTNYVLLGLIVEELTHISLHDYFARNLFKPAGMSETGVGSPGQGVAQAVGYQATLPQNPGHISWYYGCGDLTSTAEDLARLDIALMDGRIVQPATLASMQADAMPTGTGLASYGLGLQINPLGEQTLAGHHGGLPGFEADDEMCTAHRFGVIALGNDFGFPTSRILATVLLGCYPEEMQRLRVQNAQLAAERARREQPELTTRLTTFMNSLLTGNPSQLPGPMTEAMRSGLSPDAVTALRAAYADQGVLNRLQFVDDDEVAGLRRFHYLAIFANGKKTLTFVLDAENRLAGLLNQ